MFRPVPMLRLSVLVLERDERRVLRTLGGLGAMQLVRTAAGPDSAPLAPPDHRGPRARCEGLLARCDALRSALELPRRAEAGAVPPPAVLDALDEDLRSLETRAGELLGRRQRLQQRAGELSTLGDRMADWLGLELPLDPPERFSFLHLVTGNLPEAALETVEVDADVVLVPRPARNGRRPLIALCARQNRPALLAALQAAGFKPDPLPSSEGVTVDDLAASHRREAEAVATELQQVKAELTALTSEVERELADLERSLLVERRCLEAEEHFPRTAAAVLLTGWVAAADAPALQQRLRQITSGRCECALTPPTGTPAAQIPILLRHPRLLRPFARLVTAYGWPNYQELEPTLLVALSYVVMFGLMFGDAGHGALLVGGGLWALLAGRTAPRRDLGLLLLCGGGSSLFFGVIYGSYFGLSRFKHHALWQDPLEGNPLELMLGALAVGVVLISLGLVLNIINRLRRRDVLGAFLDKFGVLGALFYWGALALVTGAGALQARGWLPLAIVVFLLVPLAGWVVKEPIEYLLRRRAGAEREPGEGLVTATVESLVGAFEAVLSYLANTISFVRLAAYAMSHAALLLATYVLAAEVARFTPGGRVLGLLVAIGGNLVAIALEGIIASVQALRLEYYEFFGKFFSGDGQPFRPFWLVVPGPARRA